MRRVSQCAASGLEDDNCRQDAALRDPIGSMAPLLYTWQKRMDVEMTRRVSTREARDSFFDLIGNVHASKEPVVVEEKGQPFAIVISPDDFAKLRQIALEDLKQVVAQIHEENRGIDPERVYEEVTDVVEQVRQEAYDRDRRPSSHH